MANENIHVKYLFSLIIFQFFSENLIDQTARNCRRFTRRLPGPWVSPYAVSVQRNFPINQFLENFSVFRFIISH